MTNLIITFILNNEDECQNQVGLIFRIFNRKKDCSKGMSLKFTINFYHTTSCQR